MNPMNKTRVGKEEEEEGEEGEEGDVGDRLDLCNTAGFPLTHIHPKVVRREGVWYSPSGPV